MQLGYLLIFATAAAAFTGLAVLAQGRGGRRGIWLTWSAGSLVLLVLGILDWHQLPTKETPLITYILVAFVPTLASAVAVVWANTRSVSPVSAWAVGTITFLVAILPAIFISYYFLAPILPSMFGCCPL